MKKYKQFITGFLIGALLFSGITVFAEHRQIQAFYNDIKISLNGKVVELKDAKGKSIEPFIIEGTTYLPVRALAETLGMEVKYNESTNIVELVEKGEGAANMVAIEPEDILTRLPKATIYDLVNNVVTRAYVETIEENGLEITHDTESHIKYVDFYSIIRSIKKNNGILLTHVEDKDNKIVVFTFHNRNNHEETSINYPITHKIGSIFRITYDDYLNDLYPKLMKLIEEEKQE